MNEQPIFFVENFEGTLPAIRQLIEKQERDILEIQIFDLVSQFLQKLPLHIDQGSESIYYITFFAWMKSKKLLPLPEQAQQPDEGDSGPFSETILEDYYLFKQIAKQFEEIHERQKRHFIRGIQPYEKKQVMSLEPISLEQLTGVIQDIIKKSQPHTLSLQEEDWSVAEKIDEILEKLQSDRRLPFGTLFSPQKQRMELIVTFLALLELIKNGRILVVEEATTKNWVVINKHE